MARPTVVVVGLGDTGVLVASRLARTCHVVAVTTKPGLVSGQELGMRLAQPESWRRHYVLPFERFRRLDAADVRHGLVTDVDLGHSKVTVRTIEGTVNDVHYDALVIATGVSNGFWRHDRLENLSTVASHLDQDAGTLARAKVIAVIGGGASGVSAADNLARHTSADVHLFHSGQEVLPHHHPAARRWVMRILQRDGVTVHAGHRAEMSGERVPDRITEGPITWSTGQHPFHADAIVWATGGVRPHTGFLPSSVLDEQGFVEVDRHLRVLEQPNVFAVGDVAASDPLRSSARNWGHRVIVANVRSVVRGRRPRRRFRAPRHRWGSILGLQSNGLTVVTTRGGRVRVPRRLAEPLLYGVFVTRGLYGGLRKPES